MSDSVRLLEEARERAASLVRDLDALSLEAAKVTDSAHKLRERWREQVDSLVRERDAARAERDEYAKFIELRGLLDAFFLFRRGAL